MFRCFQAGKGGSNLQKPIQGDTFKRVNAHATYHLIPEQIQWLVDGLVNEKGLHPVLAKKKTDSARNEKITSAQVFLLDM